MLARPTAVAPLDAPDDARYHVHMGMSYVDCEACRCLIRSEESACPFCGQRPSVISTAGAGVRIFGLAAGLAAATMSCAAENMPNDTVAGESSVNDDDNADAVTYAGPDDSITFTTDPSSTGPSNTDTTTTTTTTSPDPTDADAVTYAGPDESESTTPFPETTETGTDTTSSGTDESSTGSSGTGDTDANG
jgi:hypothetical protein